MSGQSCFKVPKEKVNAQAERDLCHFAARHICQRCEMRRSTHAHHILLRKHGGSDRAHNLLAVCDQCHREIHAAPADAYREGWLRRLHPRPGDFFYQEAGE